MKAVSGDFADVIATHRPIFLGDDARINLHGHIHHLDSPSSRHINLSVEAIGYAPLHIDEVKRMVRDAR